MKLRSIAAFGIVIFASLQALSNVPEEVAEAFSQASVGESGGLFTKTSKHREILVDYVKLNWRELLGDFESVHVRGDTRAAKISVIGVIAEELEPLEYIEFLEAHLNLVRQRRAPLDGFVSQVMGSGKKMHFIAVNWKHPKVRELLETAMEMQKAQPDLLTQGEATFLASVAKGDLADTYDDGSGREPPETLPGIKLKRPFESLIAKAEHMTRESDEATKRDHPSGGNAGVLGEDVGTESDRSSWTSWAWLVALAILACAIWKGILKPRLTRSGGR